MLIAFEDRAMLTMTALAVFALSISSVSADPCTPATCEPGPVLIFFDNANCTGETRIYSTSIEFNVCTTSGTSSRITLNRGTHTEELTYYGSQDCGGNRTDAVVSVGKFRYFGACTLNDITRKESAASDAFILLANVNDSYISPQTFVVDTSVPETPSPSSVACTSAADCKSKGSLYYQHFSNETCQETGSEFQVDVDLIPYKCYRDRTSYVRLECLGPHTSGHTYFLDSMCTRPRFSRYNGDKCGEASSLTTTHCTSQLVMPPNPTSSASISQSVVFFTIVVAVLAVLF